MSNNCKTLWADKVSSYDLDPRSVAHALGGDVIGHNRILASGPGHSRQDRSLSVHISSVYPEGFWVTSFAGDDELLCRDHVREMLGLPSWRPSKGERAPMTRPAAPAPAAPDRDQERRAAWVRERFREIWAEAREPRGTIVQKYLAGRGLLFPEDTADLRYHPRCPWKDERGELIFVPAMVCAMRDIQTDEIVAIHRRRLTLEGEKVGKPMMLGPSRGAAVKLDPDEDVTMGLVVGEGVETCLAARQLGFTPVWALGSASTIANLPVLSGIEAITLLAENDRNGANERAVEACAMRWDAAGRDVFAGTPDFGKDMNDALNALNTPKGRNA
ncbi:toprim domain-containing protein [Microvirga sp. VF16]|uniref:DUF7146 domain-containing protein n=1 Tax=Microvirga sp. VF16 TaxID=2807101 RepID=UPI00193D7CC6|nr:toprim domain-containing protein [Microvirga sp. VF16]QRM28682.1 toprim domain-containing protein [Microvirga sp. VF16]